MSENITPVADDQITRFAEFRAALTARFGFSDDEETERVAFELLRNHPSLEPADLTRSLVVACLVTDAKKTREKLNKVVSGRKN